MASSFPADVQQIVDSLLATGQYDSEAAVVREAIRLLVQRDTLRRDVRDGIAELDRGQGIGSDEVFRELRDKAAKLGIQSAMKLREQAIAAKKQEG